MFPPAWRIVFRTGRRKPPGTEKESRPMSSQTSAAHSASAGSLRHSKTELMRQWRRRGARLRLVPGVLWGIGLLALLLDGAALAGGLILFGVDRWAPEVVTRWLDPAQLEAWRPDVSDVYQTGEGWAGLTSLLAVLCLMGSLNVRASCRWLASGLYGLGWLSLLAGLGLGSSAGVERVQLSGVAALAGVGEWLHWVGLLTLVVGTLLESCTRRGWCLLATALAGGLLQLAGMAWPDEEPVRLVVGGEAGRLGMILPGLCLLAGYGALAVGWMLGVLGLACVLARPGRVEPLAGIVHYACRCLQIGITLVAGAMLLDGSWGGHAAGSIWTFQPNEVWAIAPLLVAALVLLFRFHGKSGAPGIAVLIVGGFSGLVIGWSAWHGSRGLVALAGWVGLVNLCIAVHAGQRYLAYRPGL